MDTSSCKPTWTRIRVLLGLQDSSTLKLRPKSHTGLDFDHLYIEAKLTKGPFQCHQSYLQIQEESSGIVETSQSPESVFGAASPYWAIGPCIESESNRDASLGFSTILAFINSSRRHEIAGVLLRFRVNTLSSFKSVCETPINRF